MIPEHNNPLYIIRFMIEDDIFCHQTETTTSKTWAIHLLFREIFYENIDLDSVKEIILLDINAKYPTENINIQRVKNICDCMNKIKSSGACVQIKDYQRVYELFDKYNVFTTTVRTEIVRCLMDDSVNLYVIGGTICVFVFADDDMDPVMFKLEHNISLEEFELDKCVVDAKLKL